MAGDIGVMIVGTEAMISAEMDGTGGGDGGVFSFVLNSLMKPLFFLTTVRGRAACSDENEGTGGIACGSEMTGLALELLAEADLILEDHV